LEKDKNGKMDTRNRFQRMYDARYKKPIAENMAKLEKATPENLREKREKDNYARLSRKYGFTKRHPRTKDLIIFQTSDVIPTKIQPRTAYHRAINETQQAVITVIRKGKLESVEIKNHAKKPSNWRSVWFSGNSRRK